MSRIVIRCDSGFCREELFAVCEDPLHLAGDNYIYPLTTITLTHEKQV